MFSVGPKAALAKSLRTGHIGGGEWGHRPRFEPGGDPYFIGHLGVARGTSEQGGPSTLHPVKGVAFGSEAHRVQPASCPVSYTHLDVYKRQVYGKPIIDNVDFDAALRTWGPPAETHVIGPYHILVWSHPVVLPNPA